jgi:hypothetical protein
MDEDLGKQSLSMRVLWPRNEALSTSLAVPHQTDPNGLIYRFGTDTESEQRRPEQHNRRRLVLLAVAELLGHWNMHSRAKLMSAPPITSPLTRPGLKLAVQ